MMENSSTSIKTLTALGGIAGTALLAWPLGAWLLLRRIEKLKYAQIRTLGDSTKAFYDRKPAIDIREYAPFIIAEVIVEGEDTSEATKKGFKQVAEFIFGGNSKEDKIEMTSPVTTESGSKAKGKGEKIDMTTPVTTEMAAGRYKVAFVMPSKYQSTEDLPKPKNSNVQLREVSSHTLAAISWRGYPTPSEEVIKRKEAALRAALLDAGIEVEQGAKTKVYQYWPPFAPGPIKDYDVLLPVKRDSVPSKVDAAKTK